MVALILSEEDYEKCKGKYVATKSFSNHTVIGVGENPVDAIKEAKEKGETDPVVFYVFKENEIY
jgi:hypothetical protein